LTCLFHIKKFTCYSANSSLFHFLSILKSQVLQQCLLCKSWRNHYNRDEFSWGGLLIWFGFPFKCNPWHLPILLCTSPKKNVADATTDLSRFFPKFRKITKGTFMLQRGWIIFPSKATTISCLIFLHFLNACNQYSSCRCSEPIIDLQIKSFCSSTLLTSLCL